MTEYDSFERSVADFVVEEGNARVPDEGLDQIIASTSRVRPLPRWLALIKEPPMRISAAVTVGSPTTRAAAILVFALLLVTLAGGAFAGATRLLASSMIIVSQSGDGQFETIGAAVDEATDGDIIEIHPGHYAEEVRIIGKDVTIRGVGDRESVVVEAATARVPIGDESDAPLAFYLEDTASTISDLTVTGADGAYAVAVTGETARPTLERLSVSVVEGPDSGQVRLFWDDGASGSVTDSEIAGWINIGAAATPRFDRNALEGCTWVDGAGARPVFEENVIWGCPSGFLVVIGDGFAESSLPASGVFLGNDFQLTDAERGGFSMGNIALIVQRSEVPTEIRGNTFHDSMQGIGVRALGSAAIVDNIFEGNQTAVWIEGDDAELRNNDIRESSLYGLLIHGSPVVEGNEIESNLIGINLGANARPTLDGNTLCTNETDLKVPADNPTTLEGNEVCGGA